MTDTWVPTEKLGVGHLHISERARAYVNEALDNNRLSYGPMSRQFEESVAALHGVRHAVLSNSGTSALHVALAALMEVDDWQPGDEVIVPAITFVATANVALSLGLTPVFVDVDPLTYTIDPVLMEAAVTGRTRAVMPVHLCGLPADMAAVMAVANRHGLRVVEDSCETMFVSAAGRPVGSHGDIGCFSTYAAHLLVTGVGGLSVTDDPELAVIMRSLCNHGRDGIYIAIDDDAGKGGAELGEVISRRFNFVRTGYSYRLTEMEAALGLGEIETYQSALTARRRNADALSAGLADLAAAGLLQLPTVPDYAEHAYMMYPLLLADDVARDQLTLFLEERGIETRPLLPLINQPVYRRIFGDIEDRYPVARRINRSGFYIGCHPGIGAREVAYIVDAFTAYFASRR